MNKKLLTILSISLLLTSGCGKVAELKNGEQVVGKLNGKTITANELYEELKEKGGSTTFINMVDEFIANKEIKTDDSVKNEANSQLEQLKLQYESMGQSFDDVLKGAGYSNEDELLEELILEVKKQKVVKNYLKENVKEDEINDYYEKNIEGEITARHILIIPDVNDDMSDEEKTKEKEKAKEKAEKLIKELNDGKDFKELAKKESEDEGSKENGGLIENITKDSVVEPFYNAVKELKDGEYTKEPVESSYGYHIILRESQKEKPKLEEVKDDILEKIVEKKLSSDENIYSTTWEEIRKKYKLDIQDSEIKKGYNDSLK